MEHKDGIVTKLKIVVDEQLRSPGTADGVSHPTGETRPLSRA